jgi:hypothetical protein
LFVNLFVWGVALTLGLLRLTLSFPPLSTDTLE